MKVFISADMEGVSGVARGAMSEERDPDFGRARELMTGDVNAAIQGCLDAGATEIWVRDAHGSATNLLLEKLLPPAQLIQGWAGVARMMEGVDETCDAALLVGYHAQAMTARGTISHTMTGQTRRLWYNGVELGEYGISAAHAGHFGVPVVFVSGDETLCEQAISLLGGDVETTAVKSAYARECVRCLPVEEARQRIRQGAARAVQRHAEVPPFRPATPIEVRLQYQTPMQAAAAALVPTVTQVDDTTVVATVANGLAAANLVEVLLAVAR